MLEHLPAFQQYLSSKRRSAKTLSAYSAVLARFSVFLDARGASGPPTTADIETFLARLSTRGERRSVASYNQDLAALRAFSAYATHSLGWPADPTATLHFLREPARDPVVLSAGELRRLFFAGSTAKDACVRSRTLAVIALLSQAGLRVHELTALNAGQVDLVGATLVGVSGKGGTLHDLPLNAPACSLLLSWLGERSGLAKPGEPALFVSSRGTRISVRFVQRLLVSLRGATGTPKLFSPHSLRHSTATLALVAGTDLATVADLLRHSRLDTTRRYLHLVDERRREAVRRLAPTVPTELLSPVNNSLDVHEDLSVMQNAAA